MTTGFGTDNLAYVPEGSHLNLWDVYRWRKLTLDVRRCGVSPRPPGRAVIEEQLHDWLRRLEKKAGTSSDLSIYHETAQDLIEKLDGAAIRSASALLVEREVPPELVLWLRLSDHPAESFFEEDYEEGPVGPDLPASYAVYGSLTMKGLGDLEIPLPGTGAAAPLALVTTEGGITETAIERDEPLPLVDEYCGSMGVSSRGNTINLGLGGEIVADHLACAPVRRLGPMLYATLYLHLSSPAGCQVTARLTDKRHDAAAEALAESAFDEISSGKNWRIFERRGYLVHLYRGLEGKESAGVPLLPALAVAGLAGGETALEPRAALLRQVLDASAP
ncbi:hypothetical protein HZA57_10250 [Candidatus Poribacteria bacterium]|nr:hypothetical protein [Candidatus Poribacteria bacterium]